MCSFEGGSKRGGDRRLARSPALPLHPPRRLGRGCQTLAVWGGNAGLELFDGGDDGDDGDDGDGGDGL